MNPLVSLATPVYNAAPYLDAYLDSVEAQSWRPLRVIAVDDSSDDGSLDILMARRDRMAEAGIDYHVLPRPHAGQAAAICEALPLVGDGFFAWCDADDVLMPGSVERKASYLMDHPEIGMVRSDGMHILGGQASWIAKEWDRATQNIFDALFRGTTYVNGGYYMVRTSLFFECYPDRRIPISPEGQNLQLLLPPASRSLCGFIPEDLFHYHQRPDGHASRRRSLTEQLRRSENFARLRAEILNYCDCDRELYLEINEERRLWERNELLASAAELGRKEAYK